MKQKSIIWGLLSMMMVALMSAAFVACGDDDDDDDSSTGSSVVGTWSGQDGRASLTLTFKSDGTGSYVSLYEDPYSGTEREKGAFSYEMESPSKGMIIVKYYNSYSSAETEIEYFEIEGRKLYLYDDGYGTDLVWVLTKQ